MSMMHISINYTYIIYINDKCISLVHQGHDSWPTSATRAISDTRATITTIAIRATIAISLPKIIANLKELSAKNDFKIIYHTPTQGPMGPLGQPGPSGPAPGWVDGGEWVVSGSVDRRYHMLSEKYMVYEV